LFLTPADWVRVGQIIVVEENRARRQQRLVFDWHVGREDDLVLVIVVQISARLAAACLGVATAGDDACHVFALGVLDRELHLLAPAFQFVDRATDAIHHVVIVVVDLVQRVEEGEELPQRTDLLLRAIKDVNGLLITAAP